MEFGLWNISKSRNVSNVSINLEHFENTYHCFVHNRTKLETTLYFNGKKIISKREDTEQNMNKWLSGGLLFLGQDQVLFPQTRKSKYV